MNEISKTEFEVLDALWQGYPASAQQIIERLNQHKPWHEKTVKTLLNRLVKKQAIGFEKQQRSYYYSPLFERDSYVLEESKSLLARMFSGKLAPMVSNFAKSDELSQQDIDELKALIKDWEQDNG
ncbi:BlaI/MecI/CopY family transcriptional regulator [Psychrobium sp. 1_MG-2023]|uniref:BlaI/MecI/CopY family transcriptional regulator n=1 Tax=Psychrobium sp. 1_MG-2023 TaxID=3062624 RepID=UPI000C3382D2|nr:BlaI/MecI/CopY family transcriptional regulator [Psychrobium sp. 1_MG-2023]MDP2561141.1 BlaI/MecI/CopY family transcriptional regulator [Psychrobium sp. 1_MG-2023]PKF55116.1 CopY family transcriptional repressor [Alteromonadales bacterium alter-6D02]